ncbi:tyrosine-type recombinase/integrase [Luteococcus sediminum]
MLFPNTEGAHLHHGSLYKVFKPARAAAGRPDLRWHDLRHTGATMAAQAGATTKELMTRLGHSTVGLAMRYQHAAAERDAELAQRLSEMALKP